MKHNAKNFIQACIHCIVSRSGDEIPRPVLTALHGAKPNETAHVDFLYMRTSHNNNITYFLLLKDDLSAYSCLYPRYSADSESVTNVDVKWISCFGSVQSLVADQGPHFTATLMTNLTKEIKVHHHFTATYCPSANERIKRLCKEVFTVAHALLSELKMPATQSLSIGDTAQKVINQSSRQRLEKSKDGRVSCRMELFTGPTPSSMLLSPMPLKSCRTLQALKQERIRKIADVGKLHGALDNVYRDVAIRNEQVCTRARQVDNAKAQGLPPVKSSADFVMLIVNTKMEHKLQKKSEEPMGTTETKSQLLFVAGDINHLHKMIAHAQRVIPYLFTAQHLQASKELQQ